MRGKRSKAYRKLMSQYHQTFGFREPYQVLVDAEMVKEATKCTMDLPAALERTVRGKVKPMITHCSIRHLHALPAADYPNKSRIIDTAKLCERRKCNHHELEEPLPEKGCIESVVLKNGENKHRYLIASQAKETRAMFREVPGVPSIIINRSVMILEPMNNASLQRRDRDERGKFLKGVVDPRIVEQVLKKRKREGDEDGEKEGEEGEGAAAPEKRRKKKGPKGANPLSVRKKKPVEGKQRPKHPPGAGDGGVEGQAKKRRKRKHGKATGGSQDALPKIEE